MLSKRSDQLQRAIVLASLTLAAATGATAADFSASYTLILNGADFYGTGENLTIGASRMSADGSTVLAYCYNYNGSERNLFLIDVASGSRTDVTLPAGGTWALNVSLAISGDGSSGFFVDSSNSKLYRVEGGPTTTLVLDAAAWPAINGIYAVRTNSAGTFAYFEEYWDDVWRVAETGGVPELVVEDSAVAREGGAGWRVDSFAVAADGNSVAFVLYGYNDGLRGTTYKPEVFMKTDASYQQLTDDAVPGYKKHTELCGDGSVITYYDQGVMRWTSIRSDGDAKTELHIAANNVGGSSLTHDGQFLFFNDSSARGGHMVRTDGLGGLDLFAAGIGVAATYDPQISANGTQVSFVAGTTRLYAGRLDPSTPVSPGPTVGAITFVPPELPAGDPGATVVLTTAIDDPGGLADVALTSTDHLLDGMLNNDSANHAAYFNFVVHDDGLPPDATADDGVFSTEGETGGTYGSATSVTVRVGAQDVDGNVFIRDATLTVCPAAGCAIFADGFESGNTSSWTFAAP